MADRRQSLQILGSLLAAALIVLVTVLVVSAKIGPGGVASEPREERLEEAQEDADGGGRGRGRGRSGGD